MRTRVKIGLFTFAGIVAAVTEHDLAAMYVAITAGALIYLLHAIEAKINLLLDHAGIAVRDIDIGKD